MTAVRSAIELTRHELLWVVEQCGGDGWPYPLRRAHWPAETEEETAVHRARAEAALGGRGLLAPGAASLLLAVGDLVRDWRLAVDLVHRSTSTPRAGVGVSDGRRAAVLVSTDHTEAPVLVSAAPPDRLPEAVLAVLPSCARGTGVAVGVPADALRPGQDTSTDAAPATRRGADARRHARRLLDSATGWAQAGVAVRPLPAGPGTPGPPVRREPLVMWLDGPHGRHRVVHDRRGGPVRALVAPVDDAELAADLHRVISGAPPLPPGRSAA